VGRTLRSLKVPDAIIAATALHLELALVTRNINDFQKVPNFSEEKIFAEQKLFPLKLFNPFEP